MLVYVGTYTRGGSEGVYVYRMDASTGGLEYVSKATGLDNPSFLAIDPRRRHLYAVSQVVESQGPPSGSVSAFSIDPATGELTFLNRQPSVGAGPCHLTVDGTGRCVLVANYRGGSVAVLPIEDDGRLGEATDFVQHEGSSVDAGRQEGPHPHSVNLDSASRYAYVPDLGLDKVLVYKLDAGKGKLTAGDEPWVQVKTGAGPRHFAFHPGGRFAYVINELDSTFTAFACDNVKGTLREVQTVSTLPVAFEGESHCADVHVSPSGEFLYGSNRGHDSIVVFAIDGDTGTLTYVGHEPTQGMTPRNFAIDPTGAFLLAANQDSDSIVTFRVDRRTGKLEPTGHVAQVSMPVCLKLVPVSP